METRGGLCFLAHMVEEKREPHGPERLRVYHLARQLEAEVDAILTTVRCKRSLSSQLDRAVQSVLLNIAEGAAHYSSGKKVYHYQLANGSAAECIAALTILHAKRPAPAILHARRNANMVCIMLTVLIRSHERRRDN